MKTDSIVLIGMAGVGKSTTGALLARALGFSFTDLDDYIVGKEQKTIQEIIDTEGEKYFLQLEKRRMLEIDLARRVTAPGGSIIYHPEVMEFLRQNSTIVYLEDSFENIKEHLRGVTASRGIVGLKEKSLMQLYDDRKLLYSKYADITVNRRGRTSDELLTEILERFSQTGKLL